MDFFFCIHFDFKNIDSKSCFDYRIFEHPLIFAPKMNVSLSLTTPPPPVLSEGPVWSQLPERARYARAWEQSVVGPGSGDAAGQLWNVIQRLAQLSVGAAFWEVGAVHHEESTEWSGSHFQGDHRHCQESHSYKATSRRSRNSPGISQTDREA